MLLLTPTDRLADGWTVTDTSGPSVPHVTRPEHVAETVRAMGTESWRAGDVRLLGTVAAVNHAHALTPQDFRALGHPDDVAERAAFVAARGFRA